MNSVLAVNCDEWREISESNPEEMEVIIEMMIFPMRHRFTMKMVKSELILNGFSGISIRTLHTENPI